MRILENGNYRNATQEEIIELRKIFEAIPEECNIDIKQYVDEKFTELAEQII